MNVIELLENLRSRNISLSVCNNQILHEGNIDENDMLHIENFKNDIIEIYDKYHTLAIATLSLAQKGIYFHDKIIHNNSLYNVPGIYHILGNINYENLKKCINIIIHRHEALRTYFDEYKGVPIQIIKPEYEIDQIKIQKFSTENINYEASYPITIWQPPLFRIQLYKENEHSFYLQWTIHHLITDAWSMGIIMKELFVLYNQEQKAENTKYGISYFQFSDKQKKELQKNNNSYESFWRKEFHNYSPITLFPPSRPLISSKEIIGNYQTLHINEESNHKIKSIAKKYKLSVFQFIMSAFYLLVYKHTNQEQLTIGYLNSNRDFINSSTIGLFINIVPLLLNIDENKTFLDLIKMVKRGFIRTMCYGKYPLTEILEVVKPDRNLYHNPLFQMVIIHEYEQIITNNDYELNSISYHAVDLPKSKFDFTLYVIEKNNSFYLKCEYNINLYSNEHINQILNELIYILLNTDNIINYKINEVLILPKDEKEKILVKWNETTVSYPFYNNIIELFETQVMNTPNDISLICPFESTIYYTYKELYERVNIVSSNIQNILPGQGNIAIYMERSTDLVISLLACLKSNITYIPIDPELPLNRVEHMLVNGNVQLIFTQRNLIDRLYRLDIPKKTLESCCKTCEINEKYIHKNNEDAYIIYTSGSTGTPKGVINTHAGLINRMLWMKDLLKPDKRDAVLQKTSISFDVSLWEFLLPLISGSKLVMAPPKVQRDPYNILEIIIKFHVSIVHFVPSMLNMFINNINLQCCVGILKHIVCSGEELPKWLADICLRKIKCNLYNLYGPTEAAIDVTYWKCQMDDAFVPIGRPAPNTHIYILDKKLNPVPINSIGDLYIGGIQLSKGYINNPKLTQSVFLKNTNILLKDKYIYKTGDLACFHDNGSIEFKGRNDRQIKINGFRIELSEIEEVLMKIPNVSESCVVVNSKSPHNKSIVAYIKVINGIKSTLVREELKKHLPYYMIPSYFVQVAKIPRLENGKVDHSSLPMINRENIDLPPIIALPDNANEEILIKIWKLILNIESVSIDDNYFDLGGDSIKSIQIVNLAQKEGIFVGIEDIFRYKTIRKIVSNLKNNYSQEQDESTERFSLISKEDYSKIDFNIVEDAYPISTLQKGLIFHHANQENYNCYVTSITVDKINDTVTLKKAICLVIKRQSVLRTFYDLSTFSIPLQLVRYEVIPDVEIYDLSKMDKDIQEVTIKDYLQHAKTTLFEWNNPPLIKFAIHIIDKNRIIFTIIEPFLDGWSVSILFKEIIDSYLKLKSNDSFYLPTLKTQYNEFIRLELESIESKEEKDFWEKYCSSIHPGTILPWPILYPPKAQLLRNQYTLSFFYSNKLKEIAKKLAVPLKSVLLAIHLKVLNILSGYPNAATGIMLNGRPESDNGIDIAGLFLNTLPLYIPKECTNWEDFIQSTYEAELNILPHRRYPLALIQQNVKKNLFEVIFNYVHFYKYKELKENGVNIIKIEANDQTYFPLTVQFSSDWENENIKLSLDFDNRIYPSAQIESIYEYYTYVISELCISNNFNINITPSDQKLILKWNNNKTEISEQNNYIELFKEQVSKVPLNTAIKTLTEEISYIELDTYSDIIAQALLQYNCPKKTSICVIAERGYDLLASFLAILKCGYIYVPVLPSWPIERKKYVLRQTNSPIIVSNNSIHDQHEFEQKYINLDILNKNIKELQYNKVFEKKDDLYNEVAYIIFTSGSSGSPKGVQVEHKGMLNHLLAKVEELQLSKETVIAQTASQCFDISIWQMLAPLIVGGKVVFISDDILFCVASFLEYIDYHQISILEVVPSYLRSILEYINFSQKEKYRLRGLKYLIVTGEEFPVDLCQTWQTLYPHIPIVNAYGPTECSDDVSHYFIKEPINEHISNIPIGKPIRNTSIYITDKKMNLRPIGCIGELCIEGVCVGKGYINNSEQTNHSFIYSPFNSNVKLYKSGDLARFLPDGNLEFHGRMDEQIKIRGYRIELGEIKHKLLQINGIKDAAVIKVNTGKDDIIMAYLQTPKKINENYIKTILSKSLPQYMIPSKIVSSNIMPLTINGKIDYSNIKENIVLNNSIQNKYVAPNSKLEEKMCQLWAETLKVSLVGITDNFFTLGGNSLIAIQLVAKMSAMFNKIISIKDLFEYKTIKNIVNKINVNNKLQSKEKYLLINNARLNYLTITADISSYIKNNNIKIDAVSIGYIPNVLYEELTQKFDSEGFIIRRVFLTTNGNIAHILMPLFASQLFSEKKKTLKQIKRIIDYSYFALNAKCVSLTGLIPSATSYGIDILNMQSFPIKITTGHAVTCSAFIFMIEKIITITKRKLGNEVIGFLGLGSIGKTTLQLMLNLLEHPKEIILCDLYSQQEELESLKNRICNDCQYKGQITICTSSNKVSHYFYKSTFIIGATSVADVLDIEKVNKGTIIVDDSAPHCFNVVKGYNRFRKYRDILFTEAGIIQSDSIIKEVRLIPLDNSLSKILQNLTSYRGSDNDIMGCIYSSLLTANIERIKPTIGLVDLNVCIDVYWSLREKGFKAPGLSIKDHQIELEFVYEFIQNYCKNNQI